MEENLDIDVDSLTFFHTVDSRKLHNGDILWTPVFQFDPPTDYRVRGRVKIENGQLEIQLIPLPIQNLKQLVCPVRFTWTLSIVTDRKSQLQDSRDVPWEKIKKVFDNAHSDYDVIDSIGVLQNDIKRCQMADDDGSVTFMWYVKLFLDHSLTSEVPAEKEAEREETVVQRADTGDSEVKRTVSTAGPTKQGKDSFQHGKVTSSALFSVKEEIDILLIGKTGHGKSSTGNTILRRNEFKISSMGSATNNIHVAWTDFYNYTIKVVDGPGVEDNCLKSAETAKKACDDMAKAMSLCPKGFHALLLVLKFTQQLTREEEDCITMLKSILGPNILRDYCVIIITHGELFDRDKQKEDFSVWLGNQESALKNLLNECSYRCVLMQNRTKDEKVKETQLRQLIETINAIKHRDVRYTSEVFNSSEQERDKLVVKVKAPHIKEKILQETNLVVSDLSKLKRNNDDLNENDAILLRTEEKVKTLLERIITEDNQTGVLSDLKDTVRCIQEKIQIEKAANKQRKEDMEIQDHMKKEYEERLANLKLQYAEEQRRLLKRFQTATEDKLLAASNPNEDKMEEWSQTMESTKKEKEQNWQDVLDKVNKDHDQQMTTLQSQYESMKALEAEMTTYMQTLSEQLRWLQGTQSPPKDPSQVTLHCTDPKGRKVSVTLPKTSPIKPLIEAYCMQTGCPYDKLKFQLGGVEVRPEQTPADLQVVDDVTIDVSY